MEIISHYMEITGEESLGALLSGYGGYWDLFAFFR